LVRLPFNIGCGFGKNCEAGLTGFDQALVNFLSRPARGGMSGRGAGRAVGHI
jgi:hypothetical protein